MVKLEPNGTVRFSFQGPDRGPVYVVGDFNDWDEKAHPMRPAGAGQWEARVNLRAGEYRFLYRADASWYVDEECPDVPNPWGSEFSLISIPDSLSSSPSSQPSQRANVR